MNSRLFAFALLTISATGLPAVKAGDVSVLIKNFDYSPMDMSIAPGDGGMEKPGWRTPYHRQCRRHVPLTGPGPE